MRKKPLLALIPLLIVGGFAFELLTPKPPARKTKVEGEVHVLPTQLLSTLSRDRFPRLGVALVSEPGAMAAAAGGGQGGVAAEPPEGDEALAQAPPLRTIVTETVTGERSYRLTDRTARAKLETAIVEDIERRTEVHAEAMLFADLAVQ